LGHKLKNFKGSEILSLTVLLDKGSVPSLNPFDTIELSTIFKLKPNLF
jgi:hypothetical protein